MTNLYQKKAKKTLINLKEKESVVLDSYFGLDAETQTLQAIGNKFHITRERVRQIKNIAISKLKANQKQLPEEVRKIAQFISQNGGIASQKYLISKFIPADSKSDQEINSLKFLTHLVPGVVKFKDDHDLDVIWCKEGNTVNAISKASITIKKILAKSKDVLTQDELYAKFQKDPFYKKNPYAKKQVVSMARATKKIKNLPGIRFGLSSWPHINPRNTRDKIFYILKELGKPLHFRKITEVIHIKDFEGRKPSEATVHNELIADLRFVLIGKGIYALTEWGYKPGTVAEVLKDILKQFKKGIEQEKLIQEVLKVRQISRNTVVMNLQTQPQFTKDEVGCWYLKQK
jgi:hypothetical protein